MAKILLVDDDRLIRLVLRHALERAGHVVIEAWSGASAAPLLDRSFDVGLFDYDLPDTNGPALLEALRGRGQSAVPVIIMTGWPRDGGEVQAMRSGAYRYLEKPFDLDQIVPIVEEALCRTRPGKRPPPQPRPIF